MPPPPSRSVHSGPIAPTGRSPPGIVEFSHGSQCPGWKLFIGDLPADVGVDTIWRWLWTSPEFSASMAPKDISISRGAESGAQKAILTFDTEVALRHCGIVCFKWWLPAEPTADNSGRNYRMLAVRFFTAR